MEYWEPFLVANLGTYYGQYVRLVEYVSVKLLYSMEYLLGVYIGVEEFSLCLLKGVSAVVDRSILRGDELEG